MKFLLVITHFSHTLQFSVHGTTHDVCLVSFLPFYISRILNMLHHMMPDEIPSRYNTFLASYTWYSTWRFITFIRKSCFFHILRMLCYVYGIRCTFSLTVLFFDQHRSQLPFRPRTSTCFRQCQVLVFSKMSFLIHFIFSSFGGIVFSSHFWGKYSTWIHLCLLK